MNLSLWRKHYENEWPPSARSEVRRGQVCDILFPEMHNCEIVGTGAQRTPASIELLSQLLRPVFLGRGAENPLLSAVFILDEFIDEYGILRQASAHVGAEAAFSDYFFHKGAEIAVLPRPFSLFMMSIRFPEVSVPKNFSVNV